ncbi:MAG: hypothetical protein IKM07_06330 [Clostridia bacterium]|nr:hypothetical protein [Clostridia bacterium]
MKTAINLGFGFPELSILEQLRRIKDAGFDAIFNRWNKPGDAHTTARAADAAGLFIQSIHAPHLGTAHIWQDTVQEKPPSRSCSPACGNAMRSA